MINTYTEYNWTWHDKLSEFGNSLLARLRKADPTMSIVGYLTTWIFDGTTFGEALVRQAYDPSRAIFVIREGNSSFARFNPFSNKVAGVYAESFGGSRFTDVNCPPEVRVYNQSKRQILSFLVEELNVQHETSFRLK